MKLIIDIPYQLYKVLKDFQDFPSDSNEGTIENVLMKAVENGTPIPDNATNGEVIKAMFPNIKIRWETISRIGITYKNNQDYITEFDLDWWNAPYQKEHKCDTCKKAWTDECDVKHCYPDYKDYQKGGKENDTNIP